MQDQPQTPSDDTTTVGSLRSRGAVRPPSVPDHQLLRYIGGGSFGEVWLARNVMGTYRAVKVVYRQTFADERPYEREYHGLERFEPVSRSHDGLVDILQAGRNDADGYFFYVMEAADDLKAGQEIDPDSYEAKTLGRALAETGRLTARECVDLGVSLAAALDHLHKHGLLHRDVKPSNIIFVNGIPKLADVGLVAGIHTLRSLPGGTEGFIPPEGPGTVRADIYALGKVLYEVSTAHDRCEFPNLPTRLDQMPDRAEFLELNEVLVKACQSDPAKRYQTAEEMRADLLLLQTGKSVRRLRLLEKRVKLLTRIGIGTAIGLVVAIGGLLLTNRALQMRNQLRQHQIARNVAQGTRFLDEGDYFRSLPPFIEALRLDRANARNVESHQLRIASVLQQSPRLVHMSFLEGYLNKAHLSRDGRFFITAATDGKTTLGDLTTGAQPTLIYDYDLETETVAFSRDGKFVVVGGKGFADVWDLEKREIVQRVHPPLTVYGAEFSPDGSQFATASGADEGGYVFIYDTISAACGRELARVSGDAFRNASFSPDGTHLVTVCENGTAQVWNCEMFAPVGAPLLHGGWVMDAEFSPDGAHYVTAGLNGKVIVADARTGAPVSVLKHPAGVASAGFSADGRFVVTACRDYTVRIWEAFTGNLVLPVLSQSGQQVAYASFLPDSRRVLGVNVNGGVSVWDLASITQRSDEELMISNPVGDRLLTIPSSGPAIIESFGASPPAELRADIPVRDAVMNGRWLVAFSERLSKDEGPVTEAQLCDDTTGQPKSISFSLESSVNFAALRADGARLATIAPKSTNVIIWDTAGRKLFTLSHIAAALHACFSPNGAWLITSAGTNAVLWDMRRGTRRHVLAHPDLVTRSAFSPDSRFLITACNSEGTFFRRAAQIWDVQTGEPVRAPFQHNDGVYFADFSPGGTRALTASEDSTARVSELGANPDAALPPLAHMAGVTEIRFSPDERWLVTACEKGRTARVWDGITGDPLTPPLKQPWEFKHAQFVGGRRAILVRRSSGESILWELKLETRPMEDLVQLSRLLSAHRRDETGALLPLSREEHEAAWLAMRNAYPQDFAVSKKEIADWHRAQALASRDAGLPRAADFHWDRAAEAESAP